jgi:hypothetical protein
MTDDEIEEMVRRLIEDNLDEETRKAVLEWFDVICRGGRRRRKAFPHEPKTISELMDAFGGPAEFATGIINKNPSAASKMKRSGSISVAYWPKIIAAAAERGIRGVSSETLMLMHAERATARSIASREKALQRAEQLRPIFAELAGLSARKIAAELNVRGVATPAGGGKWHADTVWRVRRLYLIDDE